MVSATDHARDWRTYVAGAIAVAIVAVVLGWALWPPDYGFANREQLERAEQQAQAAEGGCEPGSLGKIADAKEKQARTAQCAADTQKQRQEDEDGWQAIRAAYAAEEGDRIATRSAQIAAFTAGILTFALGASILAAYFAGAAAIHMETSANAAVAAEKRAAGDFVAEQRAWLAVNNARIMDDIQFTDGLSAFLLEFDLLNTGRTPAIDVRLSLRPIPVRDSNKIAANIEDQIERFNPDVFPASIRDNLPATVVFPGQTIPYPQFIQVGLPLFLADPNRKIISMGPVITGVFFYKSSLEPEILRYSTFAYLVDVEKGKIWSLPDKDGNRFPMPVSNVFMKAWPRGWTAT